MAKFRTDQIHNVVLMGHGGSGKTSLTEALLYKTGATNRLGRVEEGTTVADWDPEEQRRGISINLSVVPVDYGDVRINLIDTPGYMDFLGEVISALHVAEAGLVLVDAVAGVEVGTELAWERLSIMEKPTIFFVNRMARENADFQKAVLSLRDTFSDATIVPFQLPIGQGDDLKGVISLVTMMAYIDDKAVPIPEDMQEAAENARVALVEAAAEADDDLIMKYFEGEELTPEEVRGALHKGVTNRAIIPVYCGSALEDIGLDRIVKATVRYVPAPNERSISGIQNDEEIELTCDSGGPTAALVFKTIIDRYVGRMSYIRVFSGVVNKDTQLINPRTGESHRIANLFHVQGKELEPTSELIAGDIGVITKLNDVITGDSLTGVETPIELAQAVYPLPLYAVAVTPATKADSAKLGDSLKSLAEEDPTLTVENIPATKQTVLQGMGDTHIDVSVRRLESKFGVQVETALPKVPYQETISRIGKAQYRHKKQTGGAGQFAEVHMRVEPQERGIGFTYKSEVFGGAISHVFIPSIEKGIRQVMADGVIAGFPVVDVQAIVYDGKEHPVDSKDIAFQTAGREAFKQAMQEAGPVLLEPIYNIEVTVPEEYMGDIMGDFNTHRGKVLGMEQKNSRTAVQAQVPLAEIQRYGTDLRSMTQGRGVYTVEFDHYEPVPSHLTNDVVAKSKELEEEH